MGEYRTHHAGIRLGIIGGGSRCKMLLEMIEKKQFTAFNGSIAAVADINPEAPGMVKARELGIDTTTDNSSLLKRTDIDLVMELTGDPKVRRQVERRLEPETARKMLSINTLFYDLLRIRAQELNTQAKLDKNVRFLQTIVDSVQEDILIIDTRYKIVDANNAVLHSLGMERDEIIGRPCYKITHHSVTPCESPDHPVRSNRRWKRAYRLARATPISPVTASDITKWRTTRSRT